MTTESGQTNSVANTSGTQRTIRRKIPLPTPEKIAGYIGVIVTLSAVASACFNYGLYDCLEVSMDGVSLTPLDLTNDVIRWFPIFTLICLFYAWAFSNNTSSIVVRNEVRKHLSTLLKKPNKTFTAIMFMLIITPFLASIILYQSYYLLKLILAFTVFIVPIVFVLKYAKSRKSKQIMWAILGYALIALTLFFSYMIGMMAGEFKKTSTEIVAIVLQSDKSFTGTILAAHEKGMLVKVQGYAVFVKRDEIKFLNYGEMKNPDCAKTLNLAKAHQCLENRDIFKK